jgi:hypothetical protein
MNPSIRFRSGLSFLLLVPLCALPVAAQQTKFNPSVALEAGHTDNVAFTPIDQVSDTVTRLILDLPVQREWKSGTLDFRYRPSLWRYSDAQVYDRTDHLLRFRVRSEPGKVNDILFNVRYVITQQQGDAESTDSSDLFLTGRTDRKLLNVNFRFDRTESRRWKWGLEFNGDDYQYDEIEDAEAVKPEDRRQLEAAVFFGRVLSRKSTLGLRYGHANFDLEESGETDSDSLSLAYRQRVGRKMNLSLNLGGFATSTDLETPDGVEQVDDNGVYLDFRFNRNYERTRLGVQVRHTPSAGGSLPGTADESMISVTFASRGPLVWTWSVTPRWAMRDPSDPARDDVKSAALNAWVGRRLSQKFQLRLRSRYLDQEQGTTGAADRSVFTADLALLYFPWGGTRMAGGLQR